MKKILEIRIMLLLAVLVSAFAFSSCGGDDDEPEQDYGSKIAGQYAGKLESNNTVLADAYVVSITRVSNTVVTVHADFLSKSENFNVTLSNGIYYLKNETAGYINLSVRGDNLSASYTNKYGSLVTFEGKR